ncbi:MAG TPA: NAD(P)/FAD-dependent oxidoreductase [Polyangiales bacterium]
MARTAALAALKRLLLLAIGAEHGGVASRQHVEPHGSCRPIPRRTFLQAAALGTAAASWPGLGAAGCAGKKQSAQPSVAIIGAGIAGLLCGHRLKQAGVHAQIYDANNRVGGRMFTARGQLPEGQIAELGGEFIDTAHRTLHALAAELGLTLDDLLADSAHVRTQTFHFAGRVLEEVELVSAMRPLSRHLQADIAAASTDPQRRASLDATSLAAYLNAFSDLDPTLKQVLLVAYRGEFGLEPEEQSAWNLLSLIGSVPPELFQLLGDSDERYRTRGGNDLFATKLSAKLAAQIQLGHRLVRVTQQPNGRFHVALDRGASTREQDFDKLVFALPWTQLRQVELELPLPRRKRDMIAQLGYGTNSKLIGQFRSRVWRQEHAASGYAFTDLAPQELWDTSWRQPGERGLLTVFVGGKLGFEIAQGTPETRMRGMLDDLDRIFPHTKPAYVADSALRMAWPTAPHFFGSYACYRPGQAQWAGSEAERVGHLHFCGEHTSREFQGYMEGAAESGERAAREVLADLAHT